MIQVINGEIQQYQLPTDSRIELFVLYEDNTFTEFSKDFKNLTKNDDLEGFYDGTKFTI